MGPLAGYKIVDLTAFLAGPLASQMLGGMGADVIKVETPPYGDVMRTMGPTRNRGMASQYLAYNNNKRSIALDLKQPAAYRAFAKLIDTGDVFIHNMRPPAAARLKVGYESLRAINPRIIVASAPGFSQTGPYRDRAAFDDMIQGMSGVAGLFRSRDGEPSYAPFNLADKLTAYCMVTGIVTALLHRERTGRGQEVQVPMLETMLEFNSFDQLYGSVFEPPMKPGTGHPRTLSPSRRPFATKDGYICWQATTDDQYRRLFPVIGRPELASDERFLSVAARGQNATELFGLIGAQLKTRDTADWQKLFDEADVPNTPMLKLENLLTDPYVTETEFFQVYDHPTEGKLRVPSMAMQFSDAPLEMRCGPPALGEHTYEVLRDAGLTDHEIEEATRREPGKK